LIVSFRLSENGLATNSRGTGSAVHQSRHNLVEQDAVFDQKIECRGIFVRPHTDQFPVAEPEFLVPVIRVVGINLVRGVRDAEFLLQNRPSAQWDSSAADHGVSADVMVRIDDDHRRPSIARHDGRRKSRRSRAHDNHVGGPIEMDLSRSLLSLSLSRQAREACARNRAFPKEIAAVDHGTVLFLCHVGKYLRSYVTPENAAIHTRVDLPPRSWRLNLFGSSARAKLAHVCIALVDTSPSPCLEYLDYLMERPRRRWKRGQCLDCVSF
jgi:hypothetical protein